MKRLRACLRLFAFWLLTGAVYVARLFVRPIARLSPATDTRARQAIFRWWGRSMARAIGMRVRVEGTASSGPFLLVSNHLSYVDIALLAGQLRAVFVAKRDVSGWPILGRMVTAFDTIFIDRDRHADIRSANRRIAEALARGEGVVLFAEGTSSAGERVLPIKSSLLQFPAENGLPVSYAAVSYRTDERDPPASTTVCWWGEMEFLGHFLKMLALRGFEARVRFGAEEIVERDRKRLAARLQVAISGIFEPVDR